MEVIQQANMNRLFRSSFIVGFSLLMPVVALSWTKRTQELRRRSIHEDGKRSVKEYEHQVFRMSSESFRSGRNFQRWLPATDVTGAVVPRPGQGVPMLVVFDKFAIDYAAAEGWFGIQNRNSNIVTCIITMKKKSDLAVTAAKLKTNRVHFISDYEADLHLMFSATRGRVFLLNARGVVVLDRAITEPTRPEILAEVEKGLRRVL